MRRALVIASLLCCSLASRAEADEITLGEGWQPLVMQPQAWEISLTAFAALDSGNAFEPVALSPDAVYGAAPKLEVGLVHSAKRLTGFSGSSTPAGLCLTSSSCTRVYDGPGVLARYMLLDGGLTLVADGGLVTVSLADPAAFSVKLGFIVRAGGRFAVWSNPNIRVGLTGREVEEAGVTFSFNKERVNLPVWLGFRISSALSVGIETGVRGFLDGFVDNFELPATLSVDLGLSPTLGVGARAGFETLIDHGTTGEGTSVTTDARSLILVFVSRI